MFENKIKKFKSNVLGLKFLPQFIDENLNNADGGWNPEGFSPKSEITNDDLKSLNNILNRIEINNIVEIGVARNGSRSFTYTLLEKKPFSGKYCGIDIDDKSFLNNESNGIFTIKSDSNDQTFIRNYLKQIGINSISVLFIDGWHSVNTMINDWMYTDLLDSNGVVIMHDTNTHPGPNLILDAIDRNIYNVEKYCDNNFDYGISAAYRL